MLREATRADIDAMLALNVESEHFLSPLDAERLESLHTAAACRVVADDGAGVAAFLLAFREGVDYDSPNYRWFAERYPRFLYIDRVVVAATARGRGIGSALYRHAFGVARAGDAGRVVCEYDIEPPNDGSRCFHEAFGFREVGRQVLSAGKQVSLQSVILDRAPRVP